MPNHVHVLLRPRESHRLPGILHSWKSFTAKNANALLGWTGHFWQREYYDHLIRDEKEFHTVIRYIVDNPPKAGLTDWPWVGVRRQT
jgi:REP element-mobilizing transposase RayT